MSEHGFLFQAFVYLAAAVVAVPIASRLGLGSVLGYLLAGVAIGPFGLGLIGSNGQDIMHFAEFGVVMMLFLVGLELELGKLRALRAALIGMGGTQVIGTTIAVAAIAYMFGLGWKAAIAVGLILSLSSTAIVLQSLQEKGLLKTPAGQRAFAVLLFQDLAVIPMLALLPLLAPAGVQATDATHDTLISALPGWMQAIVTLAAVGSIIAGGRYVMRPAFRFIARTRLRELFTAASLLLVIGIALLMQAVGLSPALGTFVAGVVLADSEFRHELIGDIEPFKGLLLGLFFLAVGASIDFQLVAANPVTMSGVVFGLVVLKAIVLAVIARVFRMRRAEGLLFALALAQAGEFGFVLLSYAAQQRVLDATTSSLLVASVALTMALTPLLLVLYDRVLRPRLAPQAVPLDRPPDDVDRNSSVIIAGFGQFGSTVGRLLRANGITPVVLEYDSDRVEILRRLGLQVYYGDASRIDLLHAAGAHDASVLIIALGEGEKAVEIARIAREHFPHLRILARAVERSDAFNLLEVGEIGVYRDTLDTALRMGVDAMRAAGMRGHRAHRTAMAFRRHDEENLHELAKVGRVDLGDFLRRVRQSYDDLEAQMAVEFSALDVAQIDAAWDAESLIREYGSRRSSSAISNTTSN